MMKETLIANGNGINYYVTDFENENEPRYGIAEVMENDPTDKNCTDNVFFTHEEAARRCHWLCENEVYPISLLDALRNIV